jgi:molybdopterin converting factor small subunit
LKVEVQFFSYFKDATGCGATTEELPDGATIRQLMQRVHERFPKLAPAARSTLIAVDLEYASPNHILKDGDQVSLFPPVQGG